MERSLYFRFEQIPDDKGVYRVSDTNIRSQQFRECSRLCFRFFGRSVVSRASAPACSEEVLVPLERLVCGEWIAESVLCSSFSKDESRAPKPGVWLMRGAQPATSDGARLCAGSPIPALFTTPQRVVKKSILSLLYLLSGEHFRIGRYSARKSTHLSCECFANPSIHRDG